MRRRMTAARMIEALEGTGDGRDALARDAGELVLCWLAAEWLRIDDLVRRLSERGIEIEPDDLERVVLERAAAHRWAEDEETGRLVAEYRLDLTAALI